MKYSNIILFSMIAILAASCNNSNSNAGNSAVSATLTVSGGNQAGIAKFTYTITNSTDVTKSSSDGGRGVWYSYKIVNAIGDVVWPHPTGALGPDTVFSINPNGGFVSTDVELDGSTISINALPPGQYTAIFTNIFTGGESLSAVDIPILLAPNSNG